MGEDTGKLPGDRGPAGGGEDAGASATVVFSDGKRAGDGQPSGGALGPLAGDVQDSVVIEGSTGYPEAGGLRGLGQAPQAADPPGEPFREKPTLGEKDAAKTKIRKTRKKGQREPPSQGHFIKTPKHPRKKKYPPKLIAIQIVPNSKRAKVFARGARAANLLEWTWGKLIERAIDSYCNRIEAGLLIIEQVAAGNAVAEQAKDTTDLPPHEWVSKTPS